MDADLKWVIGISLTVFTFLTGAIITSFRNLANRISKSAGELHGRVDKVKDDYVRRDDLDGHIQRIDRNLTDIKRDIRDQKMEVLEAIRSSKE